MEIKVICSTTEYLAEKNETKGSRLGRDKKGKGKGREREDEYWKRR